MATEVMTAPEGRIIHKTYAVLSGAAIPQRVHVTQYDESLPVIACTLYKDGQLYTIPDGASVRLRMNKNGLPVYHEAMGIDDARHVVYLEITAQMTVLYGEFAMVLEVETSDGKTAGTSYLRLIVRQNPVQNPELDNIPDYTANSNRLTAEGVKKLQDESSTQQKAIEDKGKSTLESIPADYSTLSGKVDENTSGISELKEDIVEFKKEIYSYDDSNIEYEMGNLNRDNGRVGTSEKQVRTKEWVFCKRGTEIDIADGYIYSLLKYTKPSVANYVGVVVADSSTKCIIEEDGYYKWYLSNTVPVVVDTSISSNISVRIVTANLLEEVNIGYNKLKIFKEYNELENVIIDLKLFDDTIKEFGNSDYNSNGILVLTKLGLTNNDDSNYTLKAILYSISNNLPNKMICQVIDTNYQYNSGVKTFNLMHANVLCGYITLDLSKFVEMYGYTEISITDYSEINQISDRCKYQRKDGISANDYFAKNNNFNDAFIVFVDDDGHNKFSELRALMDSKGKKCTLAVIADKVGDSTHMSIDTLMELKANGYDIISHTKSHDVNIYGSSVGTDAYHNFSLVDDDTIYNDLKSGHDFCVKYGFNADGLAFPWGHYPETFDNVLNNPDPDDENVCGAENQVMRYTKLARKAGFAYALNSIGGVSTLHSNDMFLPREEVKESKGIEHYKHMINVAKQNGYMLIFMTHSYDTSIANMDFIGQIIDYADSVGVKVTTLKDAMSVKKKSVSIGTYGDEYHSLHISADGTLKKY